MPGVGRVESVVRWGNNWIVATKLATVLSRRGKLCGIYDTASSLRLVLALGGVNSLDEIMNDWSDEETNDPLVADVRNFYKVEKWTRDGEKGR